ncbi:hypothetical protein TVAG_396260 [Trichomonas vaginalis G3]|uniref:Pecanex C-terminal domain-containing protein n=1 Tax=Trichomonas vaginalis (strain ATCC PRA-98 / G3) TaxID=412133 RepID=A2ESD7_TRIV3|nr:pecanex family [Trichomonas vaginalis G3]EAY04440.1 hypothetical protein TVAG_396260 [Trichomonas vaginalis G3]KAI5502198.1 pecanex family [Trichomonas vaginalis G3]|eukprot:XP_001316663.1 hypothetical protein [Trichomonas vaginalis G3]
MIVFILLILVYLIPAFYDFTWTQSIQFSIVLSLFIFAIKITLVILTLIVNHTQIIPKKQQNTENTTITRKAQLSSNTPPEGIPQELWDLRNDIPYDGPITENIFSDLIDRGFEPNVVINFIKIVTESENQVSEADTSSENEKKDVLIICGHQFTLPFTRDSLDSLFGGNTSFFYVIIAFCVNFLMNVLCPMHMKTLPLPGKIWLCFVFGPALYSTLHPPEVDYYSTTTGDIYTGITRPASIACVVGILQFIQSNKLFPDLLKDSAIQENITEFIHWLYYFFVYGLYLFPLWTYLFIGHPITMLTWILEWASRYLFGHCGVTSCGNALILFIRSAILYAIITGILSANYSRLTLSLSCAIIVVILQIPTRICFKLSWRSLISVVFILCMGVVAYIGCYTGASTTFSTESVLYIFSMTFLGVFDILWPYGCAINRYIFFTTRFIPFTSNTVNFIRFLTPCFICPMVLGLTLSINPANFILTGFILIMCINKSFTEPHIFALALLIEKIFYEIELNLTDRTFGIFYSMMVLQKLVSVISVTDFWSRSRLPAVYQILDHFSGDTILEKITLYFVTLIIMSVPFADRSVTTIAFIWSFVTGAPYHIPSKFPYILLPFPPRPNSFWNQVLENRNIDIARNYLQHRTEHPIETPVYTSMTQSLVFSLYGLVRSGRLGIVSSNSFYLFLSEPLAAFVHIISIEPNSVLFQLRGLEYNDETICHLGEIAKLKDDISSYKDGVPNITSSCMYMITDWKTRATGVILWQYNVTKIKSSDAFISLTVDEMRFWSFLAFAVSAKPFIVENKLPPFELDGELDIDFQLAITVVEINVDDSMKKSLKWLEKNFMESIFTNDAIDRDKLFRVFHGHPEPIIQNAARNIVLYLSLCSMSLGPETDTTESCRAFISDTSLRYFVAPAQSTEFSEAFMQERKDLVAFEDKADGRFVLFFRLTEVVWDVLSVQKEFVRSYWASEAVEQIFFGEDNSERLSIQEDDHTMRNLIVQACDLPIGYPALVSPVMPSFSPPPNSTIS